MKIIFFLLSLAGCLTWLYRPVHVQPVAGVHRDTVVTNFFKRTNGCIAGDGGYSVPLSNGKVIWLMGDSHIDDYDTATATVPCLFQVRNTALLQPFNDWDRSNTTTLTGTRTGLKSFLKSQPNDSFFIWPGAGIQLQDTLYVYCSSLKNQGSGAFGFAVSGNDQVAKIKLSQQTKTVYAMLPDFNGISFGVGFLPDEKGDWIYAYGQKYIPSGMQADLYLARFKTAEPFTGWQFWNGRVWENEARAATVIASQSGVSGTLHVSRVKNNILLLSSQLSINCDSGTEIYSAVAHQLTGPFTRKKLIYAIDDKLQGHTPFFYAAIAHPEYINTTNELLVTYAINGYGTCVKDCINNRMDPNVYRLQAIRVPCELLFNGRL